MSGRPNSSRPPRKLRRRSPGEWQLTDAKARFSELFQSALEAPQRISRHDKDAVVVISAVEYQRLVKPAHQPESLVDFLAGLHFGELDLERGTSFDRDVEF